MKMGGPQLFCRYDACQAFSFFVPFPFFLQYGVPLKFFFPTLVASIPG